VGSEATKISDICTMGGQVPKM